MVDLARVVMKYRRKDREEENSRGRYLLILVEKSLYLPRLFSSSLSFLLYFITTLARSTIVF
jgi:hypothetical protein